MLAGFVGLASIIFMVTMLGLPLIPALVLGFVLGLVLCGAIGFVQGKLGR